MYGMDKLKVSPTAQKAIKALLKQGHSYADLLLALSKEIAVRNEEYEEQGKAEHIGGEVVAGVVAECAQHLWALAFCPD